MLNKLHNSTEAVDNTTYPKWLKNNPNFLDTFSEKIIFKLKKTFHLYEVFK